MIARFLAALMIAIAATAGHAAVEVQEVETPGGISAWLVEEHSIPFAALEIRFRGGTSLDREGKRGEVNLMMALLEEGAGDLDARGFAQARDDLAASFGFDAYRDSVSISARFLTENRDEAIALLRSALVETRFDEDAVERVKGQVQSIIRSAATDPGEIASNTLNALAFGEHPYGSSDNGTAETVAGLTREDMFVARNRAIVRDRVYVAAVGDITAAELSEILDGLLGDLPEHGPQMPERVEPALSGGVEVVPFDSPQANVTFAHKGIPRDHPDFVAAYVANEVVGGAAESRLMEEVREKRGLTYGIGAYLLPYDHSELVLGQFSTANATVAEAIDVVRDEWEKLEREGISAEELELAKTYLTGRLRFEVRR